MMIRVCSCSLQLLRDRVLMSAVGSAAMITYLFLLGAERLKLMCPEFTEIRAVFAKRQESALVPVNYAKGDQYKKLKIEYILNTN